MDRTTINSTIKGKAYEYACVIALKELIEVIRPVEIIENSSLLIARQRYQNDISDLERKNMLASAKAGVQSIIDMEPRITEVSDDLLILSLQPDDVAKQGDIRDILISRLAVKWEIGISVKHNHEALKHSRLSKRLDFGNSWYGIPSSKEYFQEIEPIFSRLESLKTGGMLWRDMADKEESVYEPILDAFSRELMREYAVSGDDVTVGLIKYLIGSNGHDYYKLVHKNSGTKVIPYNLLGTLNTATTRSGVGEGPSIISLPTRIINLTRKENSRSTVILNMDNDWSISFRIHSAKSLVEPSLKFDIQLTN